MVMQTCWDGQATSVQCFLQDPDSSSLARKGQTPKITVNHLQPVRQQGLKPLVGSVSRKGTGSLQCSCAILPYQGYWNLTSFQHVLPLPLLTMVSSQEGEP